MCMYKNINLFYIVCKVRKLYYRVIDVMIDFILENFMI